MTADDRRTPREFRDFSNREAGDAAPSQRQSKPYRASAGALVAAVVLGTGLAFGLVALIPQGWVDGLGGRNATPRKPRDGKTGQEPGQSIGEPGDLANPRVPAGGQSQPSRQTRSPAPSTVPAKQIASRLERRASARLATAKRLIAQRKRDRAVRILEDVMNRYSSTRAAVEAERLLLKMAIEDSRRP